MLSYAHMEIMWRILIGLFVAGLGAGMVIKTTSVLDFFGPIEWAEAKMGPGGSALAYKILGILIAFIGFMVATNLWSAFLQATLGSILFPNL